MTAQLYIMADNVADWPSLARFHHVFTHDGKFVTRHIMTPATAKRYARRFKLRPASPADMAASIARAKSPAGTQHRLI